jgi:hypothetical protein
MTIILILIVLSLIQIGLGYGCYNLIKQNEALEEVTLFYQTKFDVIREKSLQTEIQLKELDIKGAFEADDEVGFVFKAIKDISSDLNQTIQDTYEFTR